jgi:hypothetical protein
MWPVYAEVIETVLGDHVSADDAGRMAQILAPVIAEGRG